MPPECPDIKGLLVLPHLRVQNANAVSSPLTWGFPSITAFTGFMHALERKLDADLPLIFNAVGVICHSFEAQATTGGFTRSFHLTRNPIKSNGETAAIVEAGRIHLDVTLVFGVSGGALSGDHAERQRIATTVADHIAGMRLAGGSILPSISAPGTTPRTARAELHALADDPDARSADFRRLRRRWLPGFALVSRDDLLEQKLAELKQHNQQATVLDAWLDLSRLSYHAEHITTPGTGPEGVEWSAIRKPGWCVPIPVGYGALSPLHAAGEVVNARDDCTPHRFVESLYSIGQWIAPHRIGSARDLLWYAHTDPEGGLYRCHNDFNPTSSHSSGI